MQHHNSTYTYRVLPWVSYAYSSANNQTTREVIPQHFSSRNTALVLTGNTCNNYLLNFLSIVSLVTFETYNIAKYLSLFLSLSLSLVISYLTLTILYVKAQHKDLTNTIKVRNILRQRQADKLPVLE